MKGREETVPDAERRRATSAALKDSIEEVCRHYAPSGARAGDCWEVRGGTGAVTLRVFLAGPVQGSWTDAAMGARGDALDLVAHLSGLDADAAGALAEAERFIGRENAEPERKAGDSGGGQMPLFAALPESGGRKRPARRSGKSRKAGASRRAADTEREPPAGSQASAEEPAPGDRNTEPPPPDLARDAGPGSGKSVPTAPDPDGVSFSADDRRRIRESAENTAWIRSHLTVRPLDARAHERAKARKDGQDRRGRLSRLQIAGIVALVLFGPFVAIMGENRHGIVELVAAYGAELPEDIPVLLPDGDGG